MSDPALRRTIRRCAAVLAIPLSLTAAIPIARLEADGQALGHPVLYAADELALVVLLGAVAYLLLSALKQIEAASGAPEPESNSSAD